MSFDVYNLEFRSWSTEINVGGYRFTRADDYGSQLQKLQHRITSHSEFSISATTGTHCITAQVEPPVPEPDAIIPWSNTDATALDDITLLLSIFTTRHVFACRDHPASDEPRVIVANPQEFPWGGLTATSIPYMKAPTPEPNEYTPSGDEGLEVHLNNIWKLMNTDEWRDEYHDGGYLILFRGALQQRTVESAFTQCWTIWEHLFSILNESWMTKNTIRKINSSEKIAYLLVTYAVRENLQEKEKKRLESLASIRNRLVHFGHFPEGDSVLDDAVLFIRMTELIVAKTLGLTPSQIFNTLDKLEDFITNATTTA